MRGRLPEIRAAGAELVFVGCGSPAHARRFRERHAPGSEVYTDPSRASYQALRMKRGLAATLGPRSLWAGARSLARGHAQTAVQGDPWQQGGLVAVRAGGEVAFAQLNRDAAERPDLQAALSALVADR